ncbi:undecaprenyl-phosphate glucose phosphotransferase [Pokkaliibacter plantistimulans]|uniref:Undecaprenyl-phosphate glucose phosphotransferase n=1 Tax=Proteobacteria bacterium 228 TaxID=2083153 RepID=A0A2S5KKA5_9PROT|nr:undecaprenyl-phosphate glucose phosphotransferase [Pokkaliibacter plantistimulans]PPC74949.1 undecaprenyl-phosphate glucose phosphotransferase [Pokkaliibacter plantistimulans]
MDTTASPRRDSLLPLVRNRRLLKNHQSVLVGAQLSIDSLLITASLLYLTYLKLDEIPPTYRLLCCTSLFCMWLVYSSRGVYRRSSGLLSGSFRLITSWAIVVLLLTLIGFVTKTSEMFSRQVLLTWVTVAGVLQTATYVLAQRASKLYKEKSSSIIPTLVIGTGSTARHLAASLINNRWLPDKVIGMVRGSDTDEDEEELPVRLLGGLENLRNLIHNFEIKRIYIALPIDASEQIDGIHIDLLDLNIDVIWAPDISAMKLLNHSVRELNGLPLISLNESPLTSSKQSMLIKSMMDKTIALAAIMIFSPLMIWVALSIKRTSVGPVIFKQERTGWDGRTIKVWKFRSMRLHDEEHGKVTQAKKDDDRITPIGRFIRRTSIDELPQLFNVLQGSMSLVGPRPHALAHNDYYAKKISSYLARHRIKPGMTGLAQIMGYRGETDTIEKMQKRVEYDLLYINNWSLKMDLVIMLKTPISLLSKNIY